METIKVIVFDMGGVLVKNKAESVYRRLAERLGISYDKLMELMKNYKKELLTGKLSVEEFSKIVHDNFHIKDNVLDVWIQSYHEVMPLNLPVIGIVNRLRNDYRLAVISNVPDLHAMINRERGVFKEFELSLISCDIGLMKPSEEIFKRLVEQMDVEPSECIFIDDRAENIAPAERMGFKTIQFVDKRKLEIGLVKLGVRITASRSFS